MTDGGLLWVIQEIFQGQLVLDVSKCLYDGYMVLVQAGD